MHLNLHPIIDQSLCYPVVSIVMELCVFNHIYPFLSGLITPTQHGFLKKRSCITQLFSVLHEIGKHLDSNNQVDMFYLDLSKAFDSVDHTILLKKLKAYGISGPLLLWFGNYLADRL